mmetsp:Transcript_31140/g.71199  ORF Transcript_31140/g.71199 Transcript_31140/m.71199 type:complete len:102 (-) Transcript_31140:1718-2023(-)
MNSFHDPFAAAGAESSKKIRPPPILLSRRSLSDKANGSRKPFRNPFNAAKCSLSDEPNGPHKSFRDPFDAPTTPLSLVIPSFPTRLSNTHLPTGTALTAPT